ncbi:MAG: AMP-binding protein, partial [Bacillota bacterium]
MPSDAGALWGVCGVDATIGEELNVSPVPAAKVALPDASVLLTTSGTTGTPKVVRHSLHRLLGRVRLPKDGALPCRWLLTFHPGSFAGIQVLLTAILSGSELFAFSEPSATKLAEAAARYEVTHISGTPTFWRAFRIALGENAGEVPLQQITLGGEVADQPTLDMLAASFHGARISHIYATTEAGALFAVTDGRAGFPARWLECGVEGVRLRISDGVLEVLSPRSMEGYV